MEKTKGTIVEKGVSRRKFLRLTGVGTAAILTGGLGALTGHKRSASTEVIPASNNRTYGEDEFVPDLEIALKATNTEVPIFPGRPTEVWTFRGKVIKGNPEDLQTLEGSYLGPIIKVRKGQKVRIHFNNDIPDKSIIHWHGLHVPEEMDGHPRHVIGQGQTYVYEYEVWNRAGTYWYHPHPHGRTGPQVYAGLAGLYLISDGEEKAAGLPGEEYDIPLVIQDRTFDENNQLVYLRGGMMDRMNGFLGDRILVNGKPDFTLPVSTRVYRLRLLNGSNSRIYKLAWNDGTPLVVIGTDGGLLGKPLQRRYIMLGPGERAELWADFSDRPVGSELALLSLSFNAGTTGMMGRGMMGRGMMGTNSVFPNGASLKVMKVRVERKGKETLALPQYLSSIEHYRPEEAANYRNPRTFRLFMQNMTWTINGRTFRMEDVARDETVRLNTSEVWEFINTSSSMGMMSMPHPIHLHGPQFRVFERSGVTHEGYVDEGWKDTVLLMPGERAKLLVRFEKYAGLYLYHCHNLEHEDMGMMRNYLVRSG